MNLAIEASLDKLRYVGADLIRDLDEAVGAAISAVEDGDAEKTGVSLAFGIEHNRDGEVEVTFTLKCAQGRKGSFTPTPLGQLKLVEGGTQE